MVKAVAATERVAPKTYQEAISCQDSEKWIEAILNEFKRLDERDTWDVVYIINKRFYEIDTTWIFRHKEVEDGTIVS